MCLPQISGIKHEYLYGKLIYAFCSFATYIILIMLPAMHQTIADL
jgi:hypothetical protein